MYYSSFVLGAFSCFIKRKKRQAPFLSGFYCWFYWYIFIWFLFYLVTSRRILALVLVPVQVLALILEVGRDYSILLAVFLVPLLAPLLGPL